MPSNDLENQKRIEKTHQNIYIIGIFAKNGAYFELLPYAPGTMREAISHAMEGTLL
jgi:hypothetical protein